MNFVLHKKQNKKAVKNCQQSHQKLPKKPLLKLVFFLKSHPKFEKRREKVIIKFEKRREKDVIKFAFA
jgi:hypothetical protein